MDKKSFKLLSFVLAIIVTVMSLPMAAFASAIPQSDDIVSSDEVLISSSDIFEVAELRTATTKHFRLEDGSYYVAQYDTAVHYKDENGEWQDIDNTLAASGSEISTSNAKIKFAKKTTGNENLFTLHDGNRKLTLSLNGANKKVEGKITNNELNLGDEATQLQKMTTLDKISASVIYEEILENTDLEYVIKGMNIKENIIVKAKGESYSYSFTMDLNNLVPELNEDGGILVSDKSTGEVVFTIPAPIMWDSNKVRSNNVSYSLTDNRNGKYTLVVTADSEWMNSEERVYPVTIDPPINVASSTTNVLDMDLSADSPNLPGETGFDSIYVSNNYKIYWKLLELPNIPSSAYITNATFSLTGYLGGYPQGYIGVYDVLSDWDSSLTWNKTISSDGRAAENFTDYQRVYYNSDTDNNYTNGVHWNVTPIVKKWYSGENYGLMLNVVKDTTFLYVATFYSSRHTVVSEKPVISIEYRDMKGHEDYWSFSSLDAGYAGTGFVNNATGNLVFSIPTLTTTDAIMPVTPSLVYNSALANDTYSYPLVQTSNTESYTARGFKLNINETLIQKTYIDDNLTENYFFIWTDGDGTEHYFLPTDTPNTYQDEDGLLLTLEVGTNVCTITDIDKNIRSFSSRTAETDITSAWYLSSLSDKNGNKVTFVVDSNNRPITINLVPNAALTNIEQLKISYNTNGKIYSIWNPNSGEGVVFRYSSSPSGSTSITSGDYLRYALRAHGATTEAEWSAFYNSNQNTSTSMITVDAVAEYTYDDNGYLLVANRLLTQNQIVYAYDSIGRVISCKEYLPNKDQDGKKFTSEYNSSSTIIRTSGADDYYGDSSDIYTTYSFDSSGRLASCYSSEEWPTVAPQFLGASSYQYVDNENPKAKNNIKSSTATTQHSSNYLLNGGFEATSTTSGISNWTTTGLCSTSSVLPFDGEAHAALTVNSNNTTASIKQALILYEGSYSLSMRVDTHNSPDVTVSISAKANYDSANTVTKVVSTNENYATGSYTFAGMNFEFDTTTGFESYDITISVTGAPESDVTVYVDNIMLSRTIGVAEYDMVQNGNFEDYLVSQFWSTYEDNTITPSSERISLDGAFGDVIFIDGDIDDHKSVSQVVYQASSSRKSEYRNNLYKETEPIKFTVSCWGKGTSQCYSDTSEFGIRVYVDYYNGSSTAETEEFFFEFNKGIYDWQFMSGGFATNPELGIIDKITIVMVYKNHGGDGYFDSISLVKESSNTEFCTYNDQGYITSYDNGSNKLWYSYQNNNVKTVISSNKTIVDYQYDSLDRVIQECYSKYSGIYRPNVGRVGVTETQINWVEYTYTQYGQVSYVETVDAQTNQRTISSTSYNYDTGSHIFGYVSTEQDALGNTTRYFYNENNGRLLATIYPEGNGVSYDYDGMGNLTAVLPANVNSTETGYVENTSSASVSYGYDETTKYLETITTKPSASTSTTYTFTYDDFGKTSQITVGDKTLASYKYSSENGKLNVLTYGNGFKVDYDYDTRGNVSKVWYYTPQNGYSSVVYEYEYDADGNLFSVKDIENNQITLYNYDGEGKLIDSYVYDTQTYNNLYGTTVYYDEQSRPKYVHYSFDYSSASGATHDLISYSYSYNALNGNLSSVGVSGDYLDGSISPTYDNLGRTSLKIIDMDVNNADAFYNRLTYDYQSLNNNESARVSQVVSEVRKGSNTSIISSNTYNYTYDANGNITQIADVDGVIQYKYYYDDLSQLIREDNRAKGYTYTYTYDNAGNITSKNRYAFTTDALGAVQETKSYTYGDSTWKDLLTNYNGTAITYDAIGNPLTIGSKTLVWEGRQLSSLTDGATTTTYGYNADGIRIYKEISDGINVERHEYYISGTQKIIRETVYLNDVEQYSLIYIYDELGMPIGLKYRTPSYANGVCDCYFFEKNLQGDIVAVYNASGTKIGTYTYDAWGNVTVSTLSTNSLDNLIITSYNPFRYRGYYYDTETEWYYLQTRYYNPSWGRFLNADSYINANGDMLGYNMFAYCSNNPVNYIDPNGESIWVTLIILSSFFAIPIVSTVGPPMVDILSNIESKELSDELYNSDEFKDIDSFRERAMWYDYTAKGSEHGISGSVDVSLGLDKGGYYWDYFEMEAGVVKLSSGASVSIADGFGGSFVAESVYGSAIIKIPIFDHHLKIGAKGNLGSIGANFKIGLKNEIGLAFGVGGSVILEWE